MKAFNTLIVHRASMHEYVMCIHASGMCTGHTHEYMLCIIRHISTNTLRVCAKSPKKVIYGRYASILSAPVVGQPPQQPRAQR